MAEYKCARCGCDANGESISLCKSCENKGPWNISEDYVLGRVSYNGHPSRAHWNVSLWLYNDEGLYGLVQTAVKRCANREEAAAWLMDELPHSTPDGVAYTHALVFYALENEYPRKGSE